MIAILCVALVVYLGWLIIRDYPLVDVDPSEWPAPPSPALSGGELAGLLRVEYEPDLVIVSPRGVELPYHKDWNLDDVIETLADVDAL